MLRFIIFFMLPFNVLAEYVEPSKNDVADQRKVIEKALSKANELSESDVFLDTIKRDINTMNSIRPEHYSNGLGIEVPNYVDALKDSNYLSKVESFQSDYPDIDTRKDMPIVLVSFSMPDSTLKSLVSEAIKFGGSVVIRGLYQNDFEKTLDKIKTLSDSKDAGIAIDPTLFDRLNVKTVPAFVLPHGDVMPCGESGCPSFEHTRAFGGSSFEYFLEVIERTEKGELSNKASYWLSVIRGGA